MPSSPRVEIAPGIFAESVVKRAGSAASEPYQVYQVTGGVFDHFELDSMSSLAKLVGILSSLDGDELRSWAQEPLAEGDDRATHPALAGQRGRRGRLDGSSRRTELTLPSAARSAAAHRRFTSDDGAPRRARIWAAEALGDCLPDADWSVPLLEQTGVAVGKLVAEAMQAGASAVLVTLEIDDCRLVLTRFDEFRGGGGAARADGAR